LGKTIGEIISIQQLNLRVGIDARQVELSPFRVLGVALLLVVFFVFILVKYRKQSGRGNQNP